MIRYLAKFVTKEAYADDLLNGKLFMHCGKYYHDLEKKCGPGQGDIREGAILPNTAIYKNIYYPIYCMYKIRDEDISDGLVVIDRRVIRDFDCQGGFMVLIPFDYFTEVLKKANSNGYKLAGTEVWYGYTTINDLDKVINSNNALSLGIKHPHFQYQKEYRLIIYKDIYQDGFPNSLKEERPYVCYLKETIKGVAKKIPINSLKVTENGYVLNLIDVFGNKG